MKPWNSTLNARRDRPRRKRVEPMAGEGASVLHPGPFRSQTLRDLAAKAPHCMHCGVRNRGDVVACHSNSQEHGKGLGLKAHDVPAYLCRECHDLIDGRAGNLSGVEKVLMFLNAAYKSTVWLLQEGFLQVAA